MNAPTLLVIDDDESIRKALRRTLKQDGYTIHLASNGKEGLELLAAQPIDLVLSDNLMPGMVGLEVLQLVRERRPEVGRVLLTGNADAEVAQRAVDEKIIHRFVAKPWDDAELKGVLKAVLAEMQGARAKPPA
ncbi:MAG: response regulator [Myxococcales bacterium]